MKVFSVIIQPLAKILESPILENVDSVATKLKILIKWQMAGSGIYMQTSEMKAIINT